MQAFDRRTVDFTCKQSQAYYRLVILFILVTGFVVLLPILFRVILLCEKSSHFVNNLVDKYEWGKDDGWERNVTFDTLRDAGFTAEVIFLQDKVVTPFINRDAAGLVLHGDLKNAKLFATAIWNEIRLQGESIFDEVAVFRKTETCINPSAEAVKNYIEWLFTVGVENQPALIYLNEVNTLFDFGYSCKLAWFFQKFWIFEFWY